MYDKLISHCQQTLRRNHLEPIKKLGSGSQGIVFLVAEQKDNSSSFLSAKCIFKNELKKKPIMKRYLRHEIQCISRLKHENIVEYVRDFQDNGWIFIITQYCNQGNLTLIQLEKKSGLFEIGQCATIIDEVASALMYMHQQGISHRDIKAENVLRTFSETKKKEITKICDFGFARQADEHMKTICGTQFYMAPEIFERQNYGMTVDIWALGILLFRMLFGEFPFKSKNMPLQIKNKTSPLFDLRKIKIKQNKSMNGQIFKKLAKIFEQIFVLDPSKRISLNELTEKLKDLINPKANIKILSTNLDTDGENQNQNISPQMDKSLFLRSVITQLNEYNILNKISSLLFKHYVDRACLCILNDSKRRLSEQQLTLMIALQKSQKQEVKQLFQNLENFPIDSLRQIFSADTSWTMFSSFKDEYRLVCGYVFKQIHKNTRIDESAKIRLKFKIFCVHSFNRIFTQKNISIILQPLQKWKHSKKQEIDSNHFDFKFFGKWINSEDVVVIAETLERLNTRLYPKL